jgi:hypothetical protein
MLEGGEDLKTAVATTMREIAQELLMDKEKMKFVVAKRLFGCHFAEYLEDWEKVAHKAAKKKLDALGVEYEEYDEEEEEV